MQNEKDILKSAQELKKIPYSVPDGYFDRLKAEAASVALDSGERHRPFFTRLAPYAAMAAVFVFLVTAGTLKGLHRLLRTRWKSTFSTQA